jgi:hypothetical protein
MLADEITTENPILAEEMFSSLKDFRRRGLGEHHHAAAGPNQFLAMPRGGRECLEIVSPRPGLGHFRVAGIRRNSDG